MYKRLPLTALAIVGTLSVGFVPNVANATWPMARHDAKRNGAATGTANLTSPVSYWRAYLGGSIAGNQLLVADANGDGHNDFLFATGGQVIAKDTSDNVIWRSPTRGITRFAGLGDLNGDGVADVVAYSGDHVIVLSARSGNVEWAEPDGEMGTIGIVRVGDVSGDGKPDIVVAECGCCGANSGNSGFIWSFGSGFSSATHLATSLPVFTCGTATSITLVQADSSSKDEILLADDTHFALLDGSGSVLASTGTLGTRTAETQCTTGNIDGVAGDEAVCILNSADSPATNQRKITVFHYDYTTTPHALNVVWSKVIAPDSGGDVRWVNPLVDLDGDGKYEVVVSTNDSVNGWQTHIYDAATGNELVTAITGEIVAGTAPMETSTSQILVTSKTGTTASGWSFVRSPTAGVSREWTVTNVAPLAYPNMSLVAVEQIANQVVATDLDGDGLSDVIMSQLASSTSSGLVGYSGAGGNAQRIATLALPAGVDAVSTWVVPPLSLATHQVALARSDGVLNLLDGHLQPTTLGGTEIDIHVGGYYASGAWREMDRAPRVVSLNGNAAQAIVVADSRSALVRLDASAASLAVPPTHQWEVRHTFAPTVVAGLDGSNPGMACLAYAEPLTDPLTYHVKAVRQDGSILWDKAVSGTPLNDLAPGDFDGDGVPDFVLQLGDSSDTNLTSMAFSGADGSTLWSNAPLNPGGGGTQSPGVSIGKWDTDAYDDIYFQGAGTRVLSGHTGTQLASGGTSDAYFLPMLYDTSGSGQDEVLLTSGFSPVALYSHDLQTSLWTSADADHPYPYGAIASCPGSPAVPYLVEGSWQNPARLKITQLSGGSLGTYSTMVLAGGAKYANETAANTAGAFLGQLTAANVHANLTGSGKPTAVVGSTDGWLYAVNPCDGTLAFSINMNAQVGEAVFGDTDGDGEDEILVSVADGYLYDFKNKAIDKPAYVYDTDPDHGITDHEVSDVVTMDKLSATWATVNGATGYKVEVVTTDGKLVSTPSWQSVGAVTSTSLTGLSLKDGEKYLFAVRATSASGDSVDAISSGVTVHFTADGGVDAGPDGSGDASVGDASDSGAEAAADGAVDASFVGDAEVEEAGKDGGGEAGGSGGGCGCRESSSSSGRIPEASIGVLLALLVNRRRRRCRRES